MNDPLGLFDESDSADPLGLFSDKPKTGFKENLKLGVAQVGNTVDTAWSMLAGALARPFDEEESDRIYKEMERRRGQRLEWANPDNKEQTFGGKVVSAVGTLPAQVLSFPLSPFETGKTAVDAGETLPRAIGAQAVDTAGNIVGVALPGAIGGKLSTRLATGAGINAAQDTATRSGMEAIVQTPEAKEALGPSLESAGLSAIVGTGTALMTRNLGPQPKAKPKTPQDKLDNLKALKPTETKKEIPPAPRPVGQQELDLFGPDQTRVGLSPYETSEGQMRVGPDGVPYRDDLSQELGRVERVGGDTPDMFETAPSLGQLDLEAAAVKRQQMDDMWNQRTQDAQVREYEDMVARKQEATRQAYEQMEERLRSGAYKPTGDGQGPKTRAARADLSRGMGRSQRGGIDLNAILEALPFRFRSLEAVQTRHKNDVSLEQIKQSINRPDVPEAEKVIIKQALENADFDSDNFKNALDDASYRFGLKRDDGTIDQGGINSLGKRLNRDFEDIGLDYLGYSNFPGFVNFYKLNTSLYEANHWNEKNLLAHTRMFYDAEPGNGGKKHVIEMQSDPIQKLNVKWTPEDEAQLKELKDQFEQLKQNRDYGEQTQNLRLRIQELRNKQGSAWEGGMVRKGLEEVKPMLSTYYYRLVREELADSARKGETSVRFTDADTLVKVEMWEYQKKVAEKELAGYKKDLQFYQVSQQAQGLDHSKEIAFVENKIKTLEEGIANWSLTEGQKKIQDRYRNEIEPFLMELGGERVTDDKGNTWIEVPVAPQFAKPVLFGKKASFRDAQRGAIDFAAITDIFKQRKADELTGLKGRIPADPKAESVVEKALTESDKNPNRFFAAGASLEATKTQSTVIQSVEQIVQNWGKRAEKNTREVIFPVEKRIRMLKPQEKVELSKVLRQEFQEGVRYSPEDLVKAGFSENQALAYSAVRDLFDRTLQAQNEARAARGERPIKGEEAYYSSVWRGDFGQRIVDEKGNTKWIVRAETKLGAKRQAEQILKLFPELKSGPEFTKLSARGDRAGSLQTAYTTMLDILGRNDPTVMAIKQLMEQQSLERAEENVMGQTQHFKEKAGVRGFIGDRPWMNPVADANDFFKAQIDYAKGAFRWSEIQKASENLNKILADPQLNETQPKNITWAKDYVARDLGFGEIKEIRDIENALGRVTGVSPNGVANAIGQMKFLWITQKLALSPGYIASNAFQLANTLPWHTKLAQEGYLANPASSAAGGFVYGLNLANYHYLKYTSWNSVSDYVKTAKMIPDHVVGAMEYAEANGVTNRSVYDEAGVDPNRAAMAVQQSVSIPETYARSMAYMGFVQHLFDSGQFPKERWQEMYQMAERYTNMAMGDARQSERAPIFAKAGLTGNMFNTLQTYTINWFNQYAHFSKMAMQGKPLPLFVGLTTTAVLSGMMGLPLAQDIHNIWEWFKKQLPNDVWTQVKDWDIKMAVMEALGESGTYGVLSDVSGVNWSSRLASPQLLEAPTMPGGMLTDIAEQASNWLSAGISMTDAYKWHQAAISSAPPGLKELYAQTFAKQYTQSPELPDGTVGIFARKDIANREATVKRDQNQQDIAKWGVRSQKEVVEGDLNNFRRTQELQMRERRTKQIDKMYRQLRVRDLDSMKDDVELYITLGGNPEGLIQGLERKVQNEFLSREQRGQLSAVDNIEQAKLMIKLKQLKESFGYAN